MQGKEFTFKLNLSEGQGKELAMYMNSLSPEDMLFGLRFAYNRKTAQDGGYLLPGRKSKVKGETHGLTQDLARKRLDNWKTMIKTYREKGYSYPTIFRIKKQIRKIANEK